MTREDSLTGRIKFFPDLNPLTARSDEYYFRARLDHPPRDDG
jgi:hypothetical protein